MKSLILLKLLKLITLMTYSDSSLNHRFYNNVAWLRIESSISNSRFCDKLALNSQEKKRKLCNVEMKMSEFSACVGGIHQLEKPWMCAQKVKPQLVIAAQHLSWLYWPPVLIAKNAYVILFPFFFSMFFSSGKSSFLFTLSALCVNCDPSVSDCWQCLPTSQCPSPSCSFYRCPWSEDAVAHVPSCQWPIPRTEEPLEFLIFLHIPKGLTHFLLRKCRRSFTSNWLPEIVYRNFWCLNLEPFFRRENNRLNKL